MMNQPARGTTDVLEAAHDVIYLYGFICAGTVLDLQGVETMAIGDVAAAFGRVSADEWNSAAAEVNLQDSDWLVPRICQHGQVIAVLSAGRQSFRPVRCSLHLRRCSRKFSGTTCRRNCEFLRTDRWSRRMVGQVVFGFGPDGGLVDGKRSPIGRGAVTPFS